MLENSCYESVAHDWELHPQKLFFHKFCLKIGCGADILSVCVHLDLYVCVYI